MIRPLVGAAVIGLGAGLVIPLLALTRGEPVDQRAAEIAVISAVGAALGALVALMATRWLAGRRGWVARAALGLVLVTLLGVLAQGFLFGAHFYLHAYGEHQPLSTLVGWLQLVFTTGQGVVYFGLFAKPWLWPWGLGWLALSGALAAARLSAD